MTAVMMLGNLFIISITPVAVAERQVVASSLLATARYLQRRESALESDTPPQPTRELTSQDWEAAKGKFVELSARRGSEVNETLWAKPRPAGAPAHKCGSPCVAHCIAGQPRDMITVKGLWKSIKHRLFEKFSESPIVFAVLAMGETKGKDGGVEGVEGFVRGPQEAVENEKLLPGLEYMGVDRALLLREACTDGDCLQKGLRIKCKAADLGVSKMFDQKTGIYSNLCEIQASRFRDGMELVRQYETEHQMKFDWVTRPRPDVYFSRPVAPASSLDIKAVHVSPWAACGFGGMDWFFAMPRAHADTLSRFTSEVECSQYKTNPNVSKTCDACPGCECWFAAYMYSKSVPFQALPWQWLTPAKFCGAADCPVDWEVNNANVMGLDSQAGVKPCKVDGNGTLSCPML